MSRNTDKIKKALAKYGQEAIEIDWKPLGQNVEMCGPEGGWFVETKNNAIFMAYNINDLLKEIDTYEGLDVAEFCRKRYENSISETKSTE
jgi:hypothetical protein